MFWEQAGRVVEELHPLRRAETVVTHARDGVGVVEARQLVDDVLWVLAVHDLESQAGGVEVRSEGAGAAGAWVHETLRSSRRHRDCASDEIEDEILSTEQCYSVSEV